MNPTDLLISGEAMERGLDISRLNAGHLDPGVGQLCSHGLRQPLHEELGARVHCKAREALPGKSDIQTVYHS